MSKGDPKGKDIDQKTHDIVLVTCKEKANQNHWKVKEKVSLNLPCYTYSWMIPFVSD
jgi:hypothetical protein